MIRVEAFEATTEAGRGIVATQENRKLLHEEADIYQTRDLEQGERYKDGAEHPLGRAAAGEHHV